jgi:hypothetical protein
MRIFSLGLLAVFLAFGSSGCRRGPVESEPPGALRFDGADDYVQAADQNALDVGTGDFTWEAWIKRTRTGVREDILSKKDVLADSEHDLGLLIGSDDRLNVFLRETLMGTPAVYLPSESRIGTEWTHVAAVRSQGNVTLYVDGRAEASRAVRYNVSSTGPLRIGANRLNNAGADAAPLFNFAGLIAEVRIWNVARTAEQLNAAKGQPLSGTPPGLVGYYPLNARDGSSARDRSSLRNDGSLRNGPVWAPGESPFAR